MDKPFSPPRSNSIKDYFQKSPPAQEKTTSSHRRSPLQPKELQSSTCQEVSSGLSRAPRQKRIRKPKRKQSKLQEEEQGADVDADKCIVEIRDESTIKEEGSVSLLGSDTAAPLSQINNEILADEDNSKAKDELKNHKCKNAATQSNMDENFCNDDAMSQEKCRIKTFAVRRNRKPNTGQGEMGNAEQEQSLQDTSMEVNVDETSLLNRSTVTVSFEEFLESQLQDTATDESKSTTCAAKSSEMKSCTDASDLAASMSPRTLTIQAEVHPISPDHEAVKGPQLKMASIFTRNKKESQFMGDKKLSCVNPQVNTDILPDLKRKSNVVLHEKDLELAVVESSSTPKCNQEERQQFMNAFKQPSLDGSKGKPSKSLNKSKPSKENETEEPEKKPDESNPDLTTAEPGTEQKSAKDAGKKQRRKPGKKEQMDQSEEVPVTPKKNKLLTSMEVENKSDSVEDSNRRCVKELRRSTRDQTRKLGTASVPETNPSPRKTRRREKAETSAMIQDNVAQASTPKSYRHKKNVYRAEMLSPLDKRGSPIRCVVDGCV